MLNFLIKQSQNKYTNSVLIRSNIANILIFFFSFAQGFAVVSWLSTIDYHLKFRYETIKLSSKKEHKDYKVLQRPKYCD